MDNDEGTLLDLSGQDQSSPAQSPNYITVSEAALLFEEAELPRTKRSIRRYCAREEIDHVKSENEQHLSQYFLDRDSVLTFIEQEKNLRAKKQRDTFGLDRTNPAQTGQDRLEIETGSERDRGGQADEDSGMVAFLKTQLQQKDKQIDALLERDRETNHLIKGLQDMVLRLQAPVPERDTHAPHVADRQQPEEGDKSISENEGGAVH